MALTDGLISWYDLEEASGTRTDAHGTNDLTDNNTVGSATGKVGTAADFIAANSEYLYHAASQAFVTTDFTSAFWIRADSFDNFTEILGNSRSGTEGSTSRRWIMGARPRLYVRLGTSDSWNTLDPSATMSTGTWYMIVVWYDSTNSEIGIEVYDSTQSLSTDTTAHSENMPTGDAPFLVGANADGFGSSDYDGRVDSLGVWNRVLAATERDDLWNSGNGVSYSDISASADISRTATLFGAGVATATASKNATITSAAESVGDAAITISKVQTGQLNIIGRPSVTITEGVTSDVSVAAALFGAGGQTVGASGGVSAGATANGAGGHSVTVDVSVNAAASIIGTGDQSATPSKQVSVAASALGAGQALVDAIIGSSATASASIAGSGSHSAAATPNVNASASTNGAGGHSVGAAGERQVTVSALGSGGAFTSQTVTVDVSTRAIAAGAALSVAEALVSAQASMDGAGQLLVTVTKGEVASAIDTVELQAIYDLETGLLSIYDTDTAADAIYKLDEQLEGII